VDALSKRAAELIGAKDTDGSIREAMALLSAHTEDTSDATYGNHAESMVFNLSGQDMDKFKYCGKLFDDMMGITAPRIPAKPSAAAPTAGTPGIARIAQSLATPPTVLKAKRCAENKGSGDQGCDDGLFDFCNSPPPIVFNTTGPLTSLANGRGDGALLNSLDQFLQLDSAANALPLRRDTSKRCSSRDGAAAMTTFDELDLFDDLNAEIKVERSSKRPATQSPPPALPMSSFSRLPPAAAAGACQTRGFFHQPAPARSTATPQQLSSAPQPPHLPPHQYAARAPRASIAGPVANGAPLETVTDFAFQAEVIGLLTQANRKEGDSNTNSNSCVDLLLTSATGKSWLVIQPTSSGKGKYARTLANVPGVRSASVISYCA
jgi:hypothetical protein